jgi:hypothetical protein
MGQAASQNMSGYVKSEDVVAQLRSYVKTSQLTSTRKQIIDEIDKLYAKNTQLSNYITKQELIKELDQYASDKDLNIVKDDLTKKIDSNALDAQNIYAKADDSKNYMLKTDKATYSEVTINDNNNYTTPAYWSERYLANKASLVESDDNDVKFVTPRFVTDRRTTWTVNPSNDPSLVNTRNDRFATPGWVTAKINKEKDAWTVSAANDTELVNADDKSFTTAGWTSSKIKKEKSDWTVNTKNDEFLTSVDDDKFATPGWITGKINQQKTTWTVTAANDPKLETKDDNKFPTINWTNAKLNQLKDTSTVSVRNNRSLDNNDDDKFATPSWINSKFNQNKNNWTVSALNDPSMNNNSDDKFATVAWINKKNDIEKTKSTVSTINDKDLVNIADDKFTTPGWTTAKIAQQKAEWTNSFSNDPQLKSTNDSNFATPEWVNKKINSFKPSDSVADASSDNKFVTTKYLTEFKTASSSAHNDSIFHFVSPKYLTDVWFPSQRADPNTDDASTTKYATPDFVTKKISDYVKLNPIELKTEDTEKLANRISKNVNFSAEMSKQLRNDPDILTNINNPKFDPNNSESFSKKVSDNLLLYSNDRFLLVNQVASTLTSDDQYRAALTEDIKRKAQKIDVNLIKVGDSMVTKNSPFETKDDSEKGIINPLKLGRTDSEIELTIGSGSNDEYIDSKNTYLELRGAAKTYTGAKLDNSRPKRRVKIYDDLLVDHKVAIGPNVDTLTDDLENPLDKYQLKVGGSALFTQGIDTNGSSNLGGDLTVSGNTKVTGKVGIATDPDGNYDLKVGGPVNFQKAFTVDEQSTFGGPATFNKNVAINDNLTVAQDKTSTFGGPAIFNKNVRINDNLEVAQDKNATFGGPATFNKNVIINDNLTVAQDKSATFGGPAIFNKNVDMKGDLTTNGITAGGPSTFNKDVRFNGNLDVNNDKNATFGGPATFNKNVDMKGNLTTNTFTANDSSTFNKKVDIKGELAAPGLKATSGNGHMVNVYKNAPGGNLPALLVRQNGDNSWGLVSEFRTEGNGSDRPSILFSSEKSDQTWSVGFGGTDNNFRIKQNHGHRGGDWGTERMRIDTDGKVAFPVGLHSTRVHGDMVATQVYTDDWFRVNGNGGLYWQNHGQGIQSVNPATYGNVTTYGGGKNGWAGYDINGRYTTMANGDTVGLHDTTRSWIFYNTNDDFYMQRNFRTKNDSWFPYSNGQNYIRGNTNHDSGNFRVSGNVSIRGAESNSGTSRSLRLWGDDDPNWGMYMSEPGNGRAMNGGNAPAMGTQNCHTVRFNAGADNCQGFVFQNHENQPIMGLTGRGRLTVRSSAGAGGGQNVFTGLHNADGANGRAQIVASSAYSDVVIASSQRNDNHGSTLTFATYNPDNAGDYRKFVFNQGNWGSRADKLEIGYNPNNIANPHDGINDSNTIMTIDGGNDRRVGIKNRNPTHTLDVNGATLIRGDLYVNRIFFKGNDGRWWTFNGDNHNDGIYLNKYDNNNNYASHWSGASGGRIRLGGSNF